MKIKKAFRKEPCKLIEGVLSHLKDKYSSIELQKESLKLWIKKF